MKRGKASVVWELVDVDGAQRLLVDVDAPLRPFGADPTPPQGTRMPTLGPDGSLLDDDTDTELELEQALPELPRPASPLPSTEALLKALRAKGRRT